MRWFYPGHPMIDAFLVRLAVARSFAAKLWALAKPYWFTRDKATFRIFRHSVSVRESWVGRIILAVILGLNVLMVYMAKLLNDWNGRLALSVGEQQRLAFTRVLLLKPDWIFIDEGTSALDRAAEEHIYALLRKELKGTAIISIAHRPEVVAFHDRHLHIDPDEHALREHPDMGVPQGA